MQINVSAFRADLFNVLKAARAGEEVVLTHNGDRYRLLAEDAPSRLDRILPIDGWVEGSSEADELRLKQEIQENWEKKWAQREL